MSSTLALKRGCNVGSPPNNVIRSHRYPSCWDSERNLSIESIARSAAAGDRLQRRSQCRHIRLQRLVNNITSRGTVGRWVSAKVQEDPFQTGAIPASQYCAKQHLVMPAVRHNLHEDSISGSATASGLPPSRNSIAMRTISGQSCKASPYWLMKCCKTAHRSRYETL